MVNKIVLTSRQGGTNAADAFAQMLGGASAAGKDTVQHITLDKLTPYQNQPFKPYTPEKLEELAEDIKMNGVLSPVIVRPIDGGNYQILAGHNRCNAAKLAGLESVPCIVKDVDDTTAKLIMLNTNLNQREELSFIEKANAYKMRVDALKEAGTNGPSISEIADQDNTNRKEIYRYIRLTFLIMPLQDLVDSRELSFRPAVNISYLSETEQDLVLKYITRYSLSVSVEQSEALKILSKAGRFNMAELDEVFGVLLRPKKENKEKAAPTYTSYKLPSSVNDFFKGVSKKEAQEKICKILEEYFSEI